jgi:hypothetical protein
VWDRAELPHKANLFDIQMKCGDVEPLEQTKEWVLSLPAQPFGDRTPTRRLPDPGELPEMDTALAPEGALS